MGHEMKKKLCFNSHLIHFSFFRNPDYTFCGDNLPREVMTPGPRMVLLFKAGSKPGSGFKARFQFETGNKKRSFTWVAMFLLAFPLKVETSQLFNLLFHLFTSLSKPQDLLLFRKFVLKMRSSKLNIVNDQFFEKAANLWP